MAIGDLGLASGNCDVRKLANVVGGGKDGRLLAGVEGRIVRNFLGLRLFKPVKRREDGSEIN